MQHLIPPNEEERLALLRRYEVLDTPPEETFDRITRLAARIFQVPMATISMIDERRQWYKSCYGLNGAGTPRELAFCSHAILANDLFLIADAKADPRFATNPLVTGEPFIRFYAGVPLAPLAGQNIGTLCIIDTKPRELSPPERQTLLDLAALVIDELQFRQAAAEIRQKELRFRALTENSGDVSTILSANGSIIFQSDSVERVLGHLPEDLVGRKMTEFIHPEEVAEFEAKLGEAQRAGKSAVAYRFLHRDRSFRRFEATVAKAPAKLERASLVLNSRPSSV